MIRAARTLVAAGALATLTLAARAAPARAPKRAEVSVSAAFAGALRGPAIWPGALVTPDEAGRLRTLELDDLAPLRLRLTVPF